MTSQARARQLVSILLDTQSRGDERDDAAMYLDAFDSPLVRDALCRVASDPNEDVVLAETCAETLAMFWARSGSIDRESYDALVPAARAEVDAYLRAKAPEVLPDQ